MHITGFFATLDDWGRTRTSLLKFLVHLLHDNLSVQGAILVRQTLVSVFQVLLRTPSDDSNNHQIIFIGMFLRNNEVWIGIFGIRAAFRTQSLPKPYNPKYVLNVISPASLAWHSCMTCRRFHHTSWSLYQPSLMGYVRLREAEVRPPISMSSYRYIKMKWLLSNVHVDRDSSHYLPLVYERLCYCPQ